MKIPRFTAESSLYNTRERYLLVTGKANRIDGQAIIPQEMKCSDDGRLCLDCHYDSNGKLLYCDVIWLPPVRQLVAGFREAVI
jgi:hypothetical protein